MKLQDKDTCIAWDKMKVWEAILQKEWIQSSELSWLIPLNRFIHLTEIIENGFFPHNKGSKTFLKLLFSLWDNFNTDEGALEEWVNKKHYLTIC